MGKAFRISFYQIRLRSGSLRIPLIFFMVGCFILESLRPVLEFSKAVEVPVSPYAFPHLTNDFVCQMVIMAGIVLVFCDAPFEEEGSFYLLPRAGKFYWGLGQIFYIFLMALLYVLFLLLLSVLPFLGHLAPGTEWGKIWGTLAKTNAGAQFGLTLGVTEYMVSEFQAPEALLASILLEWACAAWLGLLIYFLNKLTKSPAGTITGAFAVLLDICIANDWMNWANRFSPITLAQINAYAGWNLRYGVTPAYGICFFIFGIVGFGILGVLANYREKLGNGWYAWRKKWKRKIS